MSPAPTSQEKERAPAESQELLRTWGLTRVLSWGRRGWAWGGSYPLQITLRLLAWAREKVQENCGLAPDGPPITLVRARTLHSSSPEVREYSFENESARLEKAARHRRHGSAAAPLLAPLGRVCTLTAQEVGEGAFQRSVTFQLFRLGAGTATSPCL